MPHVTRDAVLNNIYTTQNSVEIRLPLPTTPLKTQQWVNEFATLFRFTLSDADWGADRYQVILNTGQHDEAIQCILCIEWLCEAIWLEPIGTQKALSALLHYLQQ